MVAATFFRSHGPQIHGCRQAKTAQTNYWSFVRNYLSTARIEMQIGTRAPITQDNLLQEAANRYIASGSGQHRSLARSIITDNAHISINQVKEAAEAKAAAPNVPTSPAAPDIRAAPGPSYDLPIAAERQRLCVKMPPASAQVQKRKTNSANVYI